MRRLGAGSGSIVCDTGFAWNVTVLAGLRRGGSALPSMASDREGEEVERRRGVLSVELLSVAMSGWQCL